MHVLCRPDNCIEAANSVPRRKEGSDPAVGPFEVEESIRP